MRIQSLHAHATLRDLHPSLWVRAGISLALATLLIGSAPARTLAVPLAGPCFATHNDGATVFDSANADAVQQAVDAAGAGGAVKVAGTCAGVQLRNGTSQTVFIDKALTLAGGYAPANWSTSNPQSNPTVLDAQANGRVILATAAVTMSNITVQNGKVAGINGSGANFDAEATVLGVTFWKNEGGADGGGAFFRKTAVVIDSAFIQNKGADGAGGALFLANATLTHTRFLSNTAGLGGGAYFAGDNQAMLTGVLFQGNSASRGGGAEFWGTATLSNTTFTLNTAINKAGGAYFNGSAALASSTFDRNSADVDAGGAWFNSATHVRNSTFRDNGAADSGGGAWFNAPAWVTNTMFISNSVKASAAGALFFDTAVVSRTHFIGNSGAGNAGGAWFGKAATVLESTFIGNSTHMFGGGAYFKETAVISGTTFAGNSSNNASGGASFAGAAVLTHTHFISNSTLLQGGGASFGFDGSTLFGSRFISNTSKMYGGGGYFSGPATLIGVTFTGNRASDTGGGARFDDTLVMTDAIFIGNVSDLTSGGGIYLNRASEASRITNSLFADNRAKNKGDAMYLFNPSVSGGVIDLRFVTIASHEVSAGTAVAVGKGTANLTNTIITSHTVGIEQIDTAEVNEANTLFFGNTSNTAGIINSGGGTVNADPTFRDPAGGNYRLQIGSPAIDAGIDLGVSSDLDTAPRPIFAGFDIGAYERGIVPAGLLVTATTTAPPLQPVTLLTATISAGTEPLVYTWDLGDGSPVVTGAVISHVYPAGVYTATVTVSNPNGAISGTVQIPVPYRLLASIIVKDAPLPLVLQRR